MDRCSAATQLAVQCPGLRRTAHHDGQLRREAAVHATSFKVGGQIRGNSEQNGTVGSFGESPAGIAGVLEFQVNVTVGRVRVDVSAAFVDFNITVDSMELANGLGTGHAEGSIDGVDVVELNATRYVNYVVHGNLDAFFLRIAGGHGNRIGARINVDGDAFESGFLVGGCFDDVDLDFVLVPAFDANGAVHIAKFERAVRAERESPRDFAGDAGTHRSREQADDPESQGRATRKHTSSFAAKDSKQFPVATNQLRPAGERNAPPQWGLKLKLTVEMTSTFFPSICSGVARHCCTAAVAASTRAGSPSKTLSTVKVPSAFNRTCKRTLP